MTCLEEGSRKLVGEIFAFHVRPAERREWQQSTREPRIQHVFILFQYNFFFFDIKFLRCIFQSFFVISANHPMLSVLRLRVVDNSLYCHLLGRNSVTPPKLTRDAPVTDILQPREPSSFVKYRHYF